MEVLTLIILVSVIGCGITSYVIGHRSGIVDTVTLLADEGIIELDD
jgi:hypothetical protein